MSILTQYPNEVLHKVFQYLSAEDVKELAGDSFFEPFYLQSTYRTIRFDPEPEEYLGPQTVPIIALSLPLFLENNKGLFSPRESTIKFNKAYEILAIPKECLDKFGSLDQVDTQHGISNIIEYLRISKYENIRTLSLDVVGWDTTSVNFRLPKGLRRLVLQHADSHFPIPHSVKDLELRSCSLPGLDKLPPLLKKLKLYGTDYLDFTYKFPLTLVDLDFRYRVSSTVDLSYLCNLKTLKLDSEITGFVLPTSITTLRCEVPPNVTTDLSFLGKLSYVKISIGDSAIFPHSLQHLKFSDCNLTSLQHVIDLPNIKILELQNCSISDPETLDIIYPNSLTHISIERLTVSDKTESLLKFNHLPPNLEQFQIRDLAQLRMEDSNFGFDFSIVWPNSVKVIELVGFTWFQMGDEDHQETDVSSLDGVVWPSSLELLQICGGLESIANSNFAELKNFKKLHVDKEVEVFDFIPESVTMVSQPHIVHSIMPSTFDPAISEILIFDAAVTFTSELFRQLPKLHTIVCQGCEITISPNGVNFPPLLRSLYVISCDMAPELWTKSTFPSTLESLTVTATAVRQFNVSILNSSLKEISFSGNSVKPDCIPHWAIILKKIPKLRDPKWIFSSFTKIPDLGGAYRIENVRNFSESEIVTIIIGNSKAVVYDRYTTLELSLKEEEK